MLLDASRDDLARRMAARPGHYMPVSLLDSQLATLERPGADERAITLDSSGDRDALRTRVMDWVQDQVAALAV